MLVKEVMARNPITIRPESDYLAAIAIMRAGKIRHLPVVSAQGKLVGIITETALRGIQSPDAPKKQAIQSDGVLMRIGEIMTTPVITVSPEYPLEEAAQIMVENHISCLPVVEGETLVGIITETDVFRLFVRVLGGGSPTIRVNVQVDNFPGQFASLTGYIAAVDGNILSIASNPADTPDRVNLTLRVESIDLDTLLDAIKKHPGAEVRHIWVQSATGE